MASPFDGPWSPSSPLTRLCLGSTIKSAWFQKVPPGPYSWLGWEGAFLRGHLQPNPQLTTASMVVSCSPWPCSNCPQALGGGASVFQSQVGNSGFDPCRALWFSGLSSRMCVVSHSTCAPLQVCVHVCMPGGWSSLAHEVSPSSCTVVFVAGQVLTSSGSCCRSP